jgi:hypothetical protein
MTPDGRRSRRGRGRWQEVFSKRGLEVQTADLVWIVPGCIAIGAVAGSLATWLIVRRRGPEGGNPIVDERALVRTLIDLMPDYIYAKDAAGRPALATTTTIGSVSCRVQPEDSASEEIFDRVANADKFTAYLATPLEVMAHDQFVVNGVTYTVLGFRNPARIWDLQSLALEIVP